MNIQESSSGWETEVNYDTGHDFPNNTAGMSTKSRARFKNQKTITLVLSPTKNSRQDLQTRSISRRRNTMPSSGSSGVLSSSRPALPSLSRDDSFISRLSVYSDMSHGSIDDSQIRNERFLSAQCSGQERSVTTLLDRGLHRNLAPSYSKSSTIGAQKSVTSTCRSLFLSPSAERDVSRALRALENGPTSQRRVGFTGTPTGDLGGIQEHHIRSFYNADAVASA
ncbi:hypothetical protein PWT90_02740 [Aphanocladium album]|nr:hypothetical protein PWT90_02740 [Aphanocladium album]